MRSVGADEVVDYRAEDFTRITPRFDLVLDLVAHRSVFAYRRALAPRRRLPLRRRVRSAPCCASSRSAGWPAGSPAARSACWSCKQGPVVTSPRSPICACSGEVSIHIHRTYPLEQMADALADVGEGRALGKVVVEIPG